MSSTASFGGSISSLQAVQILRHLTELRLISSLFLVAVDQSVQAALQELTQPVQQREHTQLLLQIALVL